jgi:hypothetical protein
MPGLALLTQVTHEVPAGFAVAAWHGGELPVNPLVAAALLQRVELRVLLGLGENLLALVSTSAADAGVDIVPVNIVFLNQWHVESHFPSRPLHRPPPSVIMWGQSCQEVLWKLP